LIVIGIGGAILAGTSLHARILNYGFSSGGTDSSLVGEFYGFYGTAAGEVLERGQITGFIENGAVLNTLQGGALTIVFDPSIMPAVAGTLHVGDVIAILGRPRSDGTINAIAVENIGK